MISLLSDGLGFPHKKPEERIMWKNIKGFDGYQVSDDGRVRTHNKVTHTAKHGDRRWKDRELSYKVAKGSSSRGDRRVDLWKDGKPHTVLVARLVATAFIGGELDDKSITVNHKDGNFLNNSVDNLELISLKDNINHGFDNGLYSTAIKIIVTDKETGLSTEHRSMTMASKFVGRCDGYVSNLFRKGKHEDKCYLYRRA